MRYLLQQTQINISQELTTNDEPLLKQDIESKTEETKPCISEEQLYQSNKSFVIFFFPKIYQHFICSFLLYF